MNIPPHSWTIIYLDIEPIEPPNSAYIKVNYLLLVVLLFG